jgi:hypothetical protein
MRNASIGMIGIRWPKEAQRHARWRRPPGNFCNNFGGLRSRQANRWMLFQVAEFAGVEE